MADNVGRRSTRVDLSGCGRWEFGAFGIPMDQLRFRFLLGSGYKGGRVAGLNAEAAAVM